MIRVVGLSPPFGIIRREIRPFCVNPSCNRSCSRSHCSTLDRSHAILYWQRPCGSYCQQLSPCHHPLLDRVRRLISGVRLEFEFANHLQTFDSQNPRKNLCVRFAIRRGSVKLTVGCLRLKWATSRTAFSPDTVHATWIVGGYPCS